LIYDNWGAVSDFFEALFDGIISVTKIFGQQIIARFHQAWLQVRRIFAQSINGLIDLINQGLRAIGAEDMQIEGEVGVPSQALEQNRQRLNKLQKDMDRATSKANEAVNSAGSDMMNGFTESVRSAYDEVKGLMSDIGGFFSFDLPGGSEQQNQQNSTSSGGSGEDSGVVDNADTRTGNGPVEASNATIGQQMPNLNAKLDLQTQKMKRLKQAGRSTTQMIGRGFSRVAGSIGRSVAALATGAKAAQSFGKKMMAVLRNVISQLVKMIAKLTIIAAIKQMAGLSGSFSSIGGVLQSAIPGLAEGGIVTGPTMAMIGEGSESEAVMPLSKLDKMMGGGGAGGGTLRGGGGRISQGKIEIPVELVDEAQRKGARRSTRTGRR
jgi:hypothetical protein